MEGLVAVPDPGFWRGRRVLVTGHTGFKGAWLTLWLDRLGAEVSAFALPPDGQPNLYELARVADHCTGAVQDLNEPAGVARCIERARPQIVLHLAAQSLVRRSLDDPVATFATNVIGTLNLLQALRAAPALEAILAVTTDKVYSNDNSGRPMREDDPLGGHDPYSASKAACEIAVQSFAASFMTDGSAALATARGGNVIGGGDFAEDRLVPDCVRAALAGAPVVLRHPDATRPWQHVLDCLCGYLLYAERLASAPRDTPRALNFGPAPDADLPVADLAKEMLTAMQSRHGIEVEPQPGSVEALKLALDSTRARQTLGWRDRLIGRDAIAASAGWYRRWRHGDDMHQATLDEIDAYQAGREVSP